MCDPWTPLISGVAFAPSEARRGYGITINVGQFPDQLKILTPALKPRYPSMAPTSRIQARYELVYEFTSSYPYLGTFSRNEKLRPHFPTKNRKKLRFCLIFIKKLKFWPKKLSFWPQKLRIWSKSTIFLEKILKIEKLRPRAGGALPKYASYNILNHSEPRNPVC